MSIKIIDHEEDFIITDDYFYCYEWELVDDPDTSHSYHDRNIKMDDIKLDKFFKKKGWIKDKGGKDKNEIIIPKGTILYNRGFDYTGYYRLFSINKPNGIIMGILKDQLDSGEFGECVDYYKN